MSYGYSYGHEDYYDQEYDTDDESYIAWAERMMEAEDAAGYDIRLRDVQIP